jgi:transaldolase
MRDDGADADKVLAQFAQAGVDASALAAQLQHEGAESFTKSWRELLDVIAKKHATLASVNQKSAARP